MTHEWFAKYMGHVANNVKKQDGTTRFSYKELKQALVAVETGDDDRVPEPVLSLFRNIIKIMPPMELTERQGVTLMLALLNCHMAYLLTSGEILASEVI